MSTCLISVNIAQDKEGLLGHLVIKRFIWIN